MTTGPVPPMPPDSPGLPVPPAASTIGRPTVWQALLMFAAFAILAAGSCAAFLSGSSGRFSEAWGFLFVAGLVLAAGPFTLVVFRLVRRSAREAWPTPGQAALLLLAGAVLAAGGCGGWALTLQVSSLVPVSLALFLAFLAGVAITVGAVELFGVALVRVVQRRSGAR
jgi:hypothetical protein